MRLTVIDHSVTHSKSHRTALDDTHGSRARARGARAQPSRAGPRLLGPLHDPLADCITSTNTFASIACFELLVVNRLSFVEFFGFLYTRC